MRLSATEVRTVWGCLLGLDMLELKVRRGEGMGIRKGHVMVKNCWREHATGKTVNCSSNVSKAEMMTRFQTFQTIRFCFKSSSYSKNLSSEQQLVRK